jgi:hypothetical protein
MEDQTKTTGTPDQDGGDALESTGTAGTPGTDGRNAESGDDNRWKEALEWKAKAERVNELEAKLKELEEEREQPPVADVSEDPKASRRKKVEEFKQRGDPVAEDHLDLREEVHALQRDLYLQRQLDEMPADERDRVKDHFNKNWRRLGDMKAARAELVAPKLEKEVKELREKLALLEKPPDEDVMRAPPTHGREISARQTTKKLNEAQFDANAQSIRASKGELAYLKYVKENAGNVQ